MSDGKKIKEEMLTILKSMRFLISVEKRFEVKEEAKEAAKEEGKEKESPRKADSNEGFAIYQRDEKPTFDGATSDRVVKSKSQDKIENNPSSSGKKQAKSWKRREDVDDKLKLKDLPQSGQSSEKPKSGTQNQITRNIFHNNSERDLGKRKKDNKESNFYSVKLFPSIIPTRAVSLRGEKSVEEKKGQVKEPNNSKNKM